MKLQLASREQQILLCHWMSVDYCSQHGSLCTGTSQKHVKTLLYFPRPCLLFLNDTHAHPFNGPLSRTTRVSKRQWHQLGHMQICTSLQTNNHASTPPLSFYRPDALLAAQPTVSKHWRHFFLNDNAMLSTSYFVHYHSVCHPGGGDTLIHHGHCWGIMHGLPAADKCCNAWQVGR